MITKQTTKRAAKILAERKEKYAREFERAKGNSKAIARAAAEYRSEYGKTPLKRWHNALSQAAKETASHTAPNRKPAKPETKTAAKPAKPVKDMVLTPKRYYILNVNLAYLWTDKKAKSGKTIWEWQLKVEITEVIFSNHYHFETLHGRGDKTDCNWVCETQSGEIKGLTIGDPREYITNCINEDKKRYKEAVKQGEFVTNPKIGHYDGKMFFRTLDDAYRTAKSYIKNESTGNGMSLNKPKLYYGEYVTTPQDEWHKMLDLITGRKK